MKKSIDLDEFEIKFSVISKSNNSVVYKGKNKATGKELVFKGYDQSVLGNPVVQKKLSNQLEMLWKLKGKSNIVDIISQHYRDKKVFIITELCEEGTLRKEIQSLSKGKKRIDESLAVAYIKQIINGYRHIQAAQIVHRALTPQNIFITGNRQLKIGDFSNSLYISECEKEAKQFKKSLDSLDATQIQEVLPYTGIEVLIGAPFSYASDIYSIGVIFYELLMGRLPYGGNSIQEILIQIEDDEELEEMIPENLSSASKQFLFYTLQPIADERMTPEQLFQYEFPQPNKLFTIESYDEEITVTDHGKVRFSEAKDQSIIFENHQPQIQDSYTRNRIGTFYVHPNPIIETNNQNVLDTFRQTQTSHFQKEQLIESIKIKNIPKDELPQNKRKPSEPMKNKKEFKDTLGVAMQSPIERMKQSDVFIHIAEPSESSYHPNQPSSRRTSKSKRQSKFSKQISHQSTVKDKVQARINHFFAHEKRRSTTKKNTENENTILEEIKLMASIDEQKKNLVEYRKKYAGYTTNLIDHNKGKLSLVHPRMRNESAITSEKCHAISIENQLLSYKRKDYIMNIHQNNHQQRTAIPELKISYSLVISNWLISQIDFIRFINRTIFRIIKFQKHAIYYDQANANIIQCLEHVKLKKYSQITTMALIQGSDRQSYQSSQQYQLIVQAIKIYKQKEKYYYQNNKQYTYEEVIASIEAQIKHSYDNLSRSFFNLNMLQFIDKNKELLMNLESMMTLRHLVFLLKKEDIQYFYIEVNMNEILEKKHEMEVVDYERIERELIELNIIS